MMIHLLAEWKKCSNKACSGNSHCLKDPESSDESCKCDDGYFGRAKDPGCRSAGKLISYAILKLFVNTGYLRYDFSSRRKD